MFSLIVWLGTSDFFGLNHYTTRTVSRLSMSDVKEITSHLQLMEVMEQFDSLWTWFD